MSETIPSIEIRVPLRHGDGVWLSWRSRKFCSLKPSKSSSNGARFRPGVGRGIAEHSMTTEEKSGKVERA